MHSTELKTDEYGRNLVVETQEGGYPGTVFVWDSPGVTDGVYVNALELLEAVAKASGYKVTVEYTPPAPQRVTVVYGA